MDTNSSPKVMEEVEKYVNTAQKIILDIDKVDYVSSAGLRVYDDGKEPTQDPGYNRRGSG